MSWKQHLFKPPWEHKDPEIRRDAVAGLQDAALLQALPSIIVADEKAEVRAAAARRIDDLGLLSSALQSEKNAKTSDIIAQRILSLCTSTAKDRPDLESRQMIVSNSTDRQLLELVASLAPESELRKLALGKVSRQGFLGDRAVQDPESDLRRYAATRITRLSTLRRVIDETRKSDKSLHQDLLSRLHEELLDAKDPAAIQEEALTQCIALESFTLKHPDGVENVPAGISTRWAKIEGHVSSNLLDRYRRIVARLEQDAPLIETAQADKEDLNGPQADSAPEEIKRPDTAKPAPPRTSKLPKLMQDLEKFAAIPGANPAADRLRKMQENWQQAWSSISAPDVLELALNEKAKNIFDELQIIIESALQKREEVLEQAETLLAQLGQELEDGSLHKALETRHQLTELGKTLRNERRWKAISRNMSSLHGRLQELRDWHHWSNDKIRKQLIREMEILPATDLHPDAVLDRVKSLQSQWKELEVSEQIPGDSHYHAAPWMWRKFRAAGNKAFEAAKPFLEKRDEIRDKHLQSQKQLCEQLIAAAASENPDWTGIDKLLKRTRKEMRDLDNLPHKARKSAASRLRKALEKGNAAMQTHYVDVEKQKLKLVRAATQLSYLEDMDQAIREAKRLQADWKSAGRLWRSRENELWKAFRKPLDPLFGKLKASQESDREQNRIRLNSQENLCKSLKELLTGDDDSLLEARGKVQGLKDSWRDIENPNRRLQKQFQDHAEKFDKRVADYLHKEASQIHQNWWRKSRLLHRLESALLEGVIEDSLLEDTRSKWPDSTEEEIDHLLDDRFKIITEGNFVAKTDKQTGKQATQLCIQLEFLAGLPSPKKEKDQRMKYQVDRLSRSLSGDVERMSAAAEAQLAEQEWLTLPLLPIKAYATFERRVKAAIKEINRNNSV